MGGQRIVTALMYLATPEEGGETVFPDATVQSDPAGLSDCARAGGLANKAYKGDMILFYGLRPDGKEDPLSLHASCPTLKGVRGVPWLPDGTTRAEPACNMHQLNVCVFTAPPLSAPSSTPGKVVGHEMDSCRRVRPGGR
jgi:prolyl 4-hydroxylase